MGLVQGCLLFIKNKGLLPFEGVGLESYADMVFRVAPTMDSMNTSRKLTPICLESVTRVSYTLSSVIVGF